jgi:hypothetical protein
MATGDTFGQYTMTLGTGATQLKYTLRLKDKTYGSAGIGEIIGIKKGTDSDIINGVGGITDLRRAGLVGRIRVTAKDTTGKKKTYKLWCVAANIPNAVAKLPTKKIDGSDITSAGQSLTTRFH